jgi:hypothetical protein
VTEQRIEREREREREIRTSAGNDRRNKKEQAKGMLHLCRENGRANNTLSFCT